MKKVEFKNEYALHSTANSMLVIADAGFNMEVRKQIVGEIFLRFLANNHKSSCFVAMPLDFETGYFCALTLVFSDIISFTSKLCL